MARKTLSGRQPRFQLFNTRRDSVKNGVPNLTQKSRRDDTACVFDDFRRSDNYVFQDGRHFTKSASLGRFKPKARQ